MSGGSVFLNNVDDFIAPSQACVNPLVSSKLAASHTSDTDSGKNAKLTLANDFSKSDFDTASVRPDLIKSKLGATAKKVATVSLNDCLACSGCVTSAEAVLIQEQSYERLLDKLQSTTPSGGSDAIVVAISPNSCASIASMLHISSTECFLRIATILKSLGVRYVIDASVGGDVALVEAREEFLHRYIEGRRTDWVKPAVSTAISSTEVNLLERVTTATGPGLTATPGVAALSSTAGSSAMVPRVIGDPKLHSQLPVLSSHCPGWICYAEKTQPQALPYVSTVKSAQQILGRFVKKELGLGSMGGACSVGGTSDTGDSDGHHGSNIDALNSFLLHTYFPPAADSFELDRRRSGAGGVTRAAAVGETEGDRKRGRAQEQAQVQEQATAGNDSHGLSESVGLSTALAASTGGASSSKVYFVSIQPCFDKKLEASRMDFYHSAEGEQEVDLVLSTAELWRLVEHCATIHRASRDHISDSVDDDGDGEVVFVDENLQGPAGYFLSVLPDHPHGRDAIERMLRSFSADGQAIVAASDANSGSGGYAEYIFKYAAEKLFGVNIWEKYPRLPFKEGRNPDISEVDLSTLDLATEDDLPQAPAPSATNSQQASPYVPVPPSATGTTTTPSYSASASCKGRKLKFARAYGFRNIQSIMMKLRRGTCDLDFVEIMACPSGCNNGGGQMRHTDIALVEQQLAALSRSNSSSGGGVGGGLGGGGGSGTDKAVASSDSVTATADMSGMSDVPETPAQARERIARVEHQFHSQLRVGQPDTSPLVRYLYGHFLGSINGNSSSGGSGGECVVSGPLSAPAVATLHTRYHAVPKLEVIAPLATKW